ncbi:MAG: hypothetical protein H0T95_09870 [Chthoniobacterales bacterium]|nr:hypothetical protein [Chthoniobacterales bacterium]
MVNVQVNGVWKQFPEKVHFGVLRSYVKALGLSDGLLFNFAATRLTIKRVGREFHSHPVEENISF